MRLWLPSKEKKNLKKFPSKNVNPPLPLFPSLPTFLTSLLQPHLFYLMTLKVKPQSSKVEMKNISWIAAWLRMTIRHFYLKLKPSKRPLATFTPSKWNVCFLVPPLEGSLCPHSRLVCSIMFASQHCASDCPLPLMCNFIDVIIIVVSAVWIFSSNDHWDNTHSINRNMVYPKVLISQYQHNNVYTEVWVLHLSAIHFQG